MKTIIQGVVFLAICLGVAFGVVSFMQKKETPAPAAEGEVAATDTGTEKKPDVPEKKKEVIAPPVAPLPSMRDSASPDEDPLRRIPITATPRYTPGAEETEALAKQLNDRKATLDRKEELLSERQDALNLILEDFRAEQDLVAKLRKTVDKEVDDATRDLAERAKLLDSNQAGARGKQAAAQTDAVDEVANLKKTALVYDNMPADAAAKIFISMCQDRADLSDLVVRLLSVMKERQAAKVLAEISNSEPMLAAKLTDKLRSVRQAPAAAPGGANPAAPPAQ